MHATLSEGAAAKKRLNEELESLQNNMRGLESKLRTMTSERDSSETTKASLTSKLEECMQNLKLSQAKSDQLSSELATAVRSEETAKAELRTAIRRAEEAEQTQRHLQEEGTGLMRSLDEMRPKIVELTGIRLELSEKVHALNRSLHERDSTISDLERQLEIAQDTASSATQGRERVDSEREKERVDAEKSLDELQKAYAELQNQLDDSLASARELEADRKTQRQTSVRLQDQMDMQIAKEHKHSDEVAVLQTRLEEQQRAGQESETLLEQLQLEVENLRAELTNKDAEISRLRQAASSPSSPLPQSLGDEVQSAVKQQYDLDISSAQSTIRELENSLYDAENQYRALEKQFVSMEEEVRQLQSLLNTQRTRAISRESFSGRRSDDLRRTSFGSQRSGSLPLLPPSIRIDENLPPATRHQRHVSLAMLHARMASEAETATAAAFRVHGSPRTVPPTIEEQPSRSSLDSSVPPYKRPQFLDESHVFWCASCKGDLIVL